MDHHSEFELRTTTHLPAPLTANTIELETKYRLLYAMNEDMCDAVRLTTFFIAILAVFGFLGNALVIYVFLFRYRSCNFRYFVLCLAFIDILSTLTTLPGEVFTQLNWYIYPNESLCKAKSFFNVFTVTAEAMCLMTISVDRYRKVCHPQKWQIKPSLARNVCIGIIGISFLLAVPIGFFWGLRFHDHRHFLEGKYVTIQTTTCEKGEDFEKSHLPLVYSVTLQIFCMTSLAIMICLYALIICRLRVTTFIKHQAFTAQFKFQVSVSVGSISSSDQDQLDRLRSSCVISLTKTQTKAETCRMNPAKECAVQQCLKQTNVDFPGSVNCNAEQKKMDGSQEKREADADPVNNILFETIHSAKVKVPAARFRRRTFVMLVLTVVFIVTTTLYLTLKSLIARNDELLSSMDNSDKAAYFFFMRLVFLNNVINPVVYGVLDPNFKAIIQSIRRRITARIS